MPYPFFDVTDDYTPINDAQPVVTSDTTDLPAGPCRGLYIGGAGNVVIDTAKGTTITLTALAVGQVHFIRAKRVRATNTTATGILALY